MSTDPIQLERRAGQRFDVHIPLSIAIDGRTVPGFSQNASSKGMFLYTDAELPEGATVELTFTMPSEITLAESMRVRCRGRVLRSSTSASAQKNGIAVQFDSYEYLATESESALEMARSSSPDPVRVTNATSR